jgi:hypothetical protein
VPEGDPSRTPVGTPGMGMNLWVESPLYENLKVFILMDTNKSTSRRQEQEGDHPFEGSRSANVRARACRGTDPGDRNRKESFVADVQPQEEGLEAELRSAYLIGKSLYLNEKF